MNSPDPVPTPQPVTAGAIPFYKSPIMLAAGTVVLSAACTLFPKVKALVNTYHITVEMIIDVVIAAATLAGGLVIGAKRWWSTVQPLTWTKKGAATHPATQAIVQTQAAMKAAEIPTAISLQATIEATQINPTEPAQRPAK